MDTHTCSGVGAETVVYCPQTDAEYGPHPDAEDKFKFCPYCGEQTESTHRVDEEISEVFCDDTSMSTYRFCPNCGDRIDDE